jgi:hypothetical protein
MTSFKVGRSTLRDNLISVLISILAILSLSPVIFSGISAYLILGLITVYILLLIMYLTEMGALIYKSNLPVFALVSILSLFLAIPFREFDRFSPSIVWIFLFLSVLLLDKRILLKAFSYYSSFIFIICICSIIILFLSITGVALPSKIVPRDIGGYFTSYYIAVKLSGQEYYLFGQEFYRLNGIFAEPGHFGLALSMVLFVYKGYVGTFRGKVILFTTLLTLSFGTFLLLFILLTKSIIANRRLFLLLMMILFVILFASVVPIEILERFFLNKAEGSLEDRTSEAFVVYYDYFQSYGNIFFGGGRDILEANQIRNSDYRGFVIRYGYVGCILLFLMIISLFWRKQWTIQLLGISYFAIVFFHRSWFVDYFLFLFFILILTYYGSDKDNNRGN